MGQHQAGFYDILNVVSLVFIKGISNNNNKNTFRINIRPIIVYSVIAASYSKNTYHIIP